MIDSKIARGFAWLPLGATVALCASPVWAQNPPAMHDPAEQTAPLETTVPMKTPVRILDGTEVRVRLDETLSSKTSSAGDEFGITLDDPLRLADGTVIPAGYRGKGTVTQAHKVEMMGKAGELNVRVPEIDEDTGKSKTVVRTVCLTAPLIVTSNKYLRNPASFDKNMRDHIAALVSRSKPIYLGAAVAVQWEYACYLAVCKGMIERPDAANLAPVAVQNAALEWFTVNLNRLADGSPRTLREICKFISYNPGDPTLWQRDLKSSLVSPGAPDFRPPGGIMPKIKA